MSTAPCCNTPQDKANKLKPISKQYPDEVPIDTDNSGSNCPAARTMRHRFPPKWGSDQDNVEYVKTKNTSKIRIQLHHAAARTLTAGNVANVNKSRGGPKITACSPPGRRRLRIGLRSIVVRPAVVGTVWQCSHPVTNKAQRKQHRKDMT